MNPPGQGLKLSNGKTIRWEQQSKTEGNVLVTANSTGDWSVEPGKTAGTLQTTDSQTLTKNHIPSLDLSIGQGAGSGFTGWNITNTTRLNTAVNVVNRGVKQIPLAIKLSNIKRYGVIVWKRIE